MWYPNKRQWRVIWAMAAIISFLGLVAATDGQSGLLFVMFLIDGLLLIWKLQKSASAD